MKAVANEASYELMAKVVRNVVSSLRSSLTGLLALTHDVRLCRSMFRHVHACNMRTTFLICCRPVPGGEPLGREVPPAAAQQRQNLGGAHKGARLPAECPCTRSLAILRKKHCRANCMLLLLQPRSCLRQVLNALWRCWRWAGCATSMWYETSHQIPTCLTLLLGHDRCRARWRRCWRWAGWSILRTRTSWWRPRATSPPWPT